VEREIDGDPIPERVALPVTANGRIFPRDDVDLWEFDAAAGQVVTAFALAPSLNSPLVPRLEILDAAGTVLAGTMTHPVAGADASVRLTAPAAGRYRVRITDARAQGGPAYVYRLTITTAPVPDFVFPLKAGPDGLTDVLAPHAEPVPAPAALDGRITTPGAADEWKLELKKGRKYTLDLFARRAGSPLCGVVAVRDAVGRELARSEAADAGTDPALAFSPPADGVYTVRVAERFRGRGGPGFAYRLAITDPAAGPPGFRLTVTGDPRQGGSPEVLTALRGDTAKVKVVAERFGGFAGPIALTVSGLPKGVTAKPVTIAPNQPAADITIQIGATTLVGTAPLTVTGSATVTGKRTSVPAVVPGTRFLPAGDRLFLAVGLPTPFKIVDAFVMTAAPRGGVYHRKYTVERNGFAGPIEVRLADRQARHLQGVTGPVVVVPPGATAFDYPITLPPWMELGRTCRVCVMAVGRVTDPADGKPYTVGFSSVGQNQQMIVVVGPGRLGVSLAQPSVRAEPGGAARVPVTVARGKGLTGPVTVAAVIPDHWKGVTAEPVTIPAGGRAGELVIRFGPGAAGPFNIPLTVRATAADGGSPATAEAKLDVVPAGGAPAGPAR
jgi:hypothetical protein